MNCKHQKLFREETFYAKNIFEVKSLFNDQRMESVKDVVLKLEEMVEIIKRSRKKFSCCNQVGPVLQILNVTDINRATWRTSTSRISDQVKEALEHIIFFERDHNKEEQNRIRSSGRWIAAFQNPSSQNHGKKCWRDNLC